MQRFLLVKQLPHYECDDTYAEHDNDCFLLKICFRSMRLSHKQELPSCAFRFESYLLLCISREEKEEKEGKDQGKRKTRKEEEWSGMKKEDT